MDSRAGPKETLERRRGITKTLKILVVSQVFWPDTASVSQHLTDLVEGLVGRNHEVHVITSQNGYEDPAIHYPRRDVREGIFIERIWQTGFDKSTKIGRMLNFASFNLNLFHKLLLLRKGRYRIIIGLTVPPLISFFGVIAARLKRAKFCYWTMDLQPELAIVSGYVKKGSVTARLLLVLSNHVFRHADAVLTLDRYMADYIEKRGAKKEKIHVNPVWPVMNEVYHGAMAKNPFRRAHHLNGKIVIMYSGNHAVVHPLDTLLKAALFLKDDGRLVFVFIGGGVRKKDVTLMKTENDLDNILQLPYQAREKIHLSLGAADIHAVIQGNGCTGFTHPNKIYGAMCIGRPIAYIGPKPSHITDILDSCPGNISVEHGQVEALIEKLILFANKSDEERNQIGARNAEYAHQNFERSRLIHGTIGEIERLGQPGVG
jgi:colanic acid biosynthesis glycosyl transferase WcaI